MPPPSLLAPTRSPALFLTLVLACLLLVLSPAPALAALTTVRHAHVARSPLAIDILPRLLPASAQRKTARRALLAPEQHELGWDDEWRVEVELPGRAEPVVLHLAPTPDFLHPAASSRSSAADDGASPLARSAVLAFSGFVLPAGLSPVHWSAAASSPHDAARRAFDRPDGALGWARVVVSDAGKAQFQGSFVVDGQTWHVQRQPTYAAHEAHVAAEANAAAADPTARRVVARRSAQLPASDPDALVFFRDADVARPAGGGCAHDGLAYNANPAHPVHVEGARRRRPADSNPWWAERLAGDGLFDEDGAGVSFGREQDRWLAKRQDAGGSLGSDLNFTATIGNEAGCPTAPQVIYTGVAADCAYVQRHGGADEARQAILSNWNLASGAFRDAFNVSLGIVELYVPSSTNSSCTAAPAVAAETWNVDCSRLTLNDRLSEFSRWRGQSSGWDNAGLGHLMSGCPSGTEVGVAWLGLVCVQESREQGSGAVSGTAVSSFSPVEWQVVAHETGHNLGAVHDCASQTCPGGSTSGQCCPLSATTCDAGGQFIMSPVSQEGEDAFSPCSIGNVCSAILQNVVDSSCLATPGAVTTISEQQCGNGIVEPGEDCDPGGRDSACCDPDTCRFRNGAQCDPSSSTCCEDSCTFSPASTVCRPSVGECDVADFCSGSNASCPEDATVDDGTSCSGSGNSTGLECASGVCTSRDLQCRTVGASLGITAACPNGLSTGESCTLTCANPAGGGSCLSLQSSFVDGTSCGGGQGRCNNGRCSYGSGLARAKGWYLDHLNIAIPVTIVVGIIVLLLLFFLLRAIFRCCAGPRQPKQRRAGAGAGRRSGRHQLSMGQHHAPPAGFVPHGQGPYQPPGFVPNGHGPYPPPPTYGGPPARGQWVDSSAYNGPNHR